jgi:hypothetical protein
MGTMTWGQTNYHDPEGAGYTTTHDFIYGYQADSNLLKTTESFLNYDFAPTPSGTAIHMTNVSVV